MAKRRPRVDPGQRLKSTMLKAFQLWRPFEREFREQVGIVQAKTIELAEYTTGLDHINENVRQLAGDLLTCVDSLERLAEKQFETVAELGISSMKLREIEDDPAEIGELMIDAATLAANLEMIVRQDANFLARLLKAPTTETRRSALDMLSEAEVDDWLKAFHNIRTVE